MCYHYSNGKGLPYPSSQSCCCLRCRKDEYLHVGELPGPALLNSTQMSIMQSSSLMLQSSLLKLAPHPPFCHPCHPSCCSPHQFCCSLRPSCCCPIILVSSSRSVVVLFTDNTVEMVAEAARVSPMNSRLVRKHAACSAPPPRPASATAAGKILTHRQFNLF
jgi:hypothetical protein